MLRPGPRTFSATHLETHIIVLSHCPLLMGSACSCTNTSTAEPVPQPPTAPPGRPKCSVKRMNFTSLQESHVAINLPRIAKVKMPIGSQKNLEQAPQPSDGNGASPPQRQASDGPPLVPPVQLPPVQLPFVRPPPNQQGSFSRSALVPAPLVAAATSPAPTAAADISLTHFQEHQGEEVEELNASTEGGGQYSAYRRRRRPSTSFESSKSSVISEVQEYPGTSFTEVFGPPLLQQQDVSANQQPQPQEDASGQHRTEQVVDLPDNEQVPPGTVTTTSLSPRASPRVSPQRSPHLSRGASRESSPFASPRRGLRDALSAGGSPVASPRTTACRLRRSHFAASVDEPSASPVTGNSSPRADLGGRQGPPSFDIPLTAHPSNVSANPSGTFTQPTVATVLSA